MIAFSLTINLNLRLSTPNFCHLHSFPFAVLRTALAPAFARIYLCVFASSLARSHLLLCTRIYLPAYLPWLNINAQLSLSHLAIHPWANIITGLCSRSTPRQILLQDFACVLPLGKHHHSTLLAIHPWPNLIAGLPPQSTFGQSDLSLTDSRSPHVPLHSEFLSFTPSILLLPQPSSY